MFDPASLPSFWGEHGCRFAARPGHVCRTSFGQPIEVGQCCFAEARAALRDELGAEHAWAVGE